MALILAGRPPIRRSEAGQARLGDGEDPQAARQPGRSEQLKKHKEQEDHKEPLDTYDKVEEGGLS